MNKVIQQDFQVQFQYKILFSESIFSLKNSLISKLFASANSIGTTKVVVVIDNGAVQHHPKLIKSIKTYFEACCEGVQLMGNPLIIEGGEKSKNNWTSVEKVLHLINNEKIDRHSYVIAIGGGAILDMVGFACAIGHRGVRLIRIPTTVLSQNDSGVGVKNAINYFDKKNFLGTFQTPFAVINDSTFLATLTDRDWRSGISEALKVALIKDVDFFNWLEENTELLNSRNMEVMNRLIYRCAELHTEHIGTAGDPFEQGSSRPLDFGHWAAHKLEYLTNYKLTHGEAVAIGIVLDSCYSYCIGFLAKEELQRIVNCFKNLGFNLTHPLLFDPGDLSLINPKLIKGLEEFREHLGGILTIMLLKAIGNGEEVHEVKLPELNEAIALIKEF